MKPDEIEAELDATEADPLTEEQIKQMTRYATDKDYREVVDRAADYRRQYIKLQEENEALKAKIRKILVAATQE